MTEIELKCMQVKLDYVIHALLNLAHGLEDLNAKCADLITNMPPPAPEPECQPVRIDE